MRTSASSFSCLSDVGHPAFAEAFPGEHGDGPGAEQRPHRHFERAGVGSGDDAEPIVGRAAAAARASGRSHPGAAPCRARTAVRPAENARVDQVQGSSPAAWRRDRTRNAGVPAMWTVSAGARLRLPQLCQSIQLSSQRARAALGRRGPSPVLAAIAASARRAAKNLAVATFCND